MKVQPESVAALVGVIAALVTAMVWMVKFTAKSAEKREDKLVESLDNNTSMLGQLRDNAFEQTIQMKGLCKDLGNHKSNIAQIPEIRRTVNDIRDRQSRE